MSSETPLALNDELLSAYLDGELDADTRARVEHQLSEDAGARIRLARMRDADASMRAAFAAEPVGLDDALAEYVRTGKPPRAVSEGRERTRRVATLAAIAAGVAGIAIGIAVMSSFVATTSSQQLPALVVTALESAVSGASVAGDAGTARPLLSFRADDGRFCRVFRWHAATSAEGVACRDDASWHLLAWDGTVPDSDSFQTAGASELIDATMDRLGGGDTIEVDAERDLIRDHWLSALPPRAR